jgi:hypothetical protein
MDLLDDLSTPLGTTKILKDDEKTRISSSQCRSNEQGTTTTQERLGAMPASISSLPLSLLSSTSETTTAIRRRSPLEDVSAANISAQI